MLSSKLPWPLMNPILAQQFNQIAAVPMLQGNAVSATLVASKPQAINHLLQRQPQGWFLIDNTADAVVWRTAWNQSTLTLESSANTTISLWVF